MQMSNKCPFSRSLSNKYVALLNTDSGIQKDIEPVDDLLPKIVQNILNYDRSTIIQSF